MWTPDDEVVRVFNRVGRSFVQSSKPRIGLCLVAGRRPDLLAQTLQSFQTALFDHVELAWVRVNLDPIFGTEAEANEVKRLLEDYFGTVELREPETPGFCEAVKWLWSGAPDGPFLHLEDDWRAIHTFEIDKILSHLKGRTTSICIRTVHHGGPWRKRYSEFWGLMFRRDLPIRRYPIFNTSPGFFDGAFARGAAARMDPKLDPEKQMHPSHRLPIVRYLMKYRCRYYFLPSGDETIVDMGREWRADRGIVTQITGAAKTWSGF